MATEKTLAKKLKDELDEAEGLQEQNRNLKDTNDKLTKANEGQTARIKLLEAQLGHLRKNAGFSEADVEELFRRFVVLSFDRDMQGRRRITLEGRRSHSRRPVKFEAFSEVITHLRGTAEVKAPGNPFAQAHAAEAAKTAPTKAPAEQAPPAESQKPRADFSKKSKKTGTTPEKQG